MTKKTKLIIIISVSIIVLAAITVAFLFWNGNILVNNPDPEVYSVRGVDVSHYQGEIDWQTLAGNDIDFAFIKATEGSAYADARFEYNFTEAAKTELRIGAYHFFSFESDGLSQATNFINTVPKQENMLPPVIDLEFYGSYDEDELNRERVVSELHRMIFSLRTYYGVEPIIYTTKELYSLYIAGDFEENAIWIRSVYGDVGSLSDGREWTFWQYSNRGRLEGYSGDERFIDLNVFNGTEEEFQKFGK